MQMLQFLTGSAPGGGAAAIARPPLALFGKSLMDGARQPTAAGAERCPPPTSAPGIGMSSASYFYAECAAATPAGLQALVQNP
jgi:hypothetical protein